MSANATLTAFNTPEYAALVSGASKPQPVFSAKRAPAEWKQAPVSYIVIDTEAHGLEARFDIGRKVYACVAIVVKPDAKPKVHKFFTWEEFVDFVQPLHNEGFALVCHNAKYDIPLLTTRGFRVNWKLVYCTQVLAYLLRNDRPSYSLDALVPGVKTDVVQQCVDEGVIEPMQTKDFWNHEWESPEVIEIMGEYCVSDTKACHKLFVRLCKDATEATWITYHRTEQPMLQVLVSLERSGMPMDYPLLVDSLTHYRAEVERLHATINERYGLLPKLQFNENTGEFEPVEKTYKSGCYRNATTLLADYYSPNALSIREWGGYTPTGEFVQHIDDGEPLTLYNHCKLVPYNAAAATGHTWWLIKHNCPQALEFVGKTPTGKPKMDKDFLSDICDHLPEDFPIAKLAKATRKVQTLEGMWRNLSADNRIAPDFNHTQTLTGRLSCSNPNMQNVPRAGEDPETQIFRKLIKASPGKRIAVADLDQIELRVLAYYLAKVCKDLTLKQEFDKPDADPHTANAQKWQVARVVAKTLVFLLIYGGQPALMVKRKLFQTLAEAEAAFASVHDAQPAIAVLMREVVKRCAKDGYITTLGGRKLWYPNLNSSRKYERLRAERQCFNALIQGGARDVIHQLAIETQEVLECYGSAATMVNIIHDEIVVEVSEWCADALVEDLNAVWQGRYDLLPGVRVNGDWHHGTTWYEAK